MKILVDVKTAEWEITGECWVHLLDYQKRDIIDALLLACLDFECVENEVIEKRLERLRQEAGYA